MHALPNLSFNPLSLINSSRLLRNFVFVFSLLGLGSFAWGDRFVVEKSVGNAYINYIVIAESKTAIIVGFQVITCSTNNYVYIYYTDANDSEEIIYSIKGTSVSTSFNKFDYDQSIEIAGPCRQPTTTAPDPPSPSTSSPSKPLATNP